jgi:hypothetical protein
VRQVVGSVLELSHSSKKSSQHTDFTASKTPMTCLVSADASPLLPQANSVLSPAESSSLEAEAASMKHQHAATATAAARRARASRGGRASPNRSMQMQMVRRYPPTVRARPRLCLGALICCRAAIVAEFSRQRPQLDR